MSVCSEFVVSVGVLDEGGGCGVLVMLLLL